MVQGVQGRKGYKAMKINVLGTEYKVITKKYNEEEAFKRRSICGFCDEYEKEIVICDMSTYEGWEYESKETIISAQNRTTRHEIIHAFFNESGLSYNALVNEQDSWARNEEMVDWIAIQFPKILKVYQELDIL